VFKRIAVTISVLGCVMLAIALAPNVPTALATVHTTTTKDAMVNQQPTDGSCAAFEAWFLDPACSQTQHAKKAARIKHRLAQRL
jgi:hypothetical protein